MKYSSINRTLVLYLPFLFLLWGIEEAIYGSLQLYDIVPSNHNLYKLTGSFLNPGPFAGFLATLLPLAFWYIGEWKVSNGYIRRVVIYTAWLYVFLCISLLPATMSRASWLAIGVGCGWVFVNHYHIDSRLQQWASYHRQKAVAYFCIFFLLLIVIGIGIYYFKKDSADGRLLIWKMTTRMILSHPWTGVGHHCFSGAYGEVQSAYFAEGNASCQEELVAGCPEYAFNEFLQIAAEYGILGLTVFLTTITLALRQVYKSRLTGIMGSFAAWLTFACFSYPFRVWQLNLLFLLLLLVAWFSGLTCAKHQREKFLLFIGILMLYIPSLSDIWQWTGKQSALEKWSEEQSYYYMEIYEGTVNNYRELYPYLHHDPRFLFEYGQCLSKTGDYEESNRILLEGSTCSADPMFWNVMGKNYQALRDYTRAETCFFRAYYTIPHRLYPLYLLANLYFFTGQTDKALAMAHNVIDKEPKVMSCAIEEMKSEMKMKIKIYSKR